MCLSRWPGITSCMRRLRSPTFGMDSAGSAEGDRGQLALICNDSYTCDLNVILLIRPTSFCLSCWVHDGNECKAKLM